MLRAEPDSWDRLLSQTGLLFILTPLVVFCSVAFAWLLFPTCVMNHAFWIRYEFFIF